MKRRMKRAATVAVWPISGRPMTPDDLDFRNARIRESVSAGMSMAAVARRWGITRQRVHVIVSRPDGVPRARAPGRPSLMTEQRARALRVMWRSGLSTGHIARTLGVCAATVSNWARRLDLGRRRRGRPAAVDTPTRAVV